MHKVVGSIPSTGGRGWRIAQYAAGKLDTEHRNQASVLSAGAECASQQALNCREVEAPLLLGPGVCCRGLGGTAYGTEMTSRKFLEAGPRTGYGLGQSSDRREGQRK